MIALARLLPSFSYLVIAFLVFNFYGATPERMLWLHNGIAVIILTYLILTNRPSFNNLRTSLNLLHAENKRYGLHVYYGTLANISIPYIAGVTLGIFANDNANVAFYTLALTISTPLSLAPSVIGTTYFKQFASQSCISPKVLKTTAGVSLLSLIAYIIIIFPLVDYLYDSSYQSVAIYGAFLAIAAIAQGTGDVFNRFLGAHGQGQQLRNGAWLSGIVSIIGYTLGVYYFEINGAIATRIISSLVYLISMSLYYIAYTKRPAE